MIKKTEAEVNQAKREAFKSAVCGLFGGFVAGFFITELVPHPDALTLLDLAIASGIGIASGFAMFIVWTMFERE